MYPSRCFKVFGEPVEILIPGQAANGQLSVVTQVSPKGGGPPVHIHSLEDETFTVLDGEFEIFDGATWHLLRQGESFFGERGRPHSFRSVGPSDGKIHVVITPPGIEDFLEQISSLSMPSDMPEFVRIANSYGVSFPASGTPFSNSIGSPAEFTHQPA